MSLTARQLNRATLDRQLLLRRESLDVPAAVGRVVALQAQEAASPYLALWNRLTGFAPADLDAAFAARTVVKATLMRTTLHAVHAEDYPVFHQAMLGTLRAAGLYDRRFTSTGLSTDDADALLAPLAKFVARPRTSAEIQDWLERRLGERMPGVWRALRAYAPMHYAPTGGPWSFQPPNTFVTARARRGGPAAVAGSARSLVLRYLRGFGPASVADAAQFTMLRRSVVQEALAGLTGEVERVPGVDKTARYDVVGAGLPAEDTPAPPRLLPMWDSVLLGYADRGRIVPPDYRPLLIRRNGDVLPALLVDGYVAGVWRPAGTGIEASAFHRLDGEVWRALSAEAAALVAVLADREPIVYRRYGHWWDKGLPAAEVRLLPE